MSDDLLARGCWGRGLLGALLLLGLAGCSRSEQTTATPTVVLPVATAPTVERLAALERLAQHTEHGPAAVAFLRECLGAPEPDVRSAAGSVLAASSDSELVRESMRLCGDSNATVRLSALRAGVRHAGRRVTSRVENAQRDPDPALRREALRTLAGWADPEDPELPWQWLAALQDPSPLVADAAAELLSARGRALVPLVQQAVVTADHALRLRLVGMVAGLRDAELAPTLLWILRSSDWSESADYDAALRAAVVAGVVGLGKEAVEPVRLALARTKPSAALAAVVAEIFAQLGVAEPAAVVAQMTRPALVPGDHNLELRLIGAVAGKDLRVDFACRQGQWPATGWGYAPNFSKGDHEATLRRVGVIPGGVEVEMDVKVADDPWVRGGPAELVMTLTGSGAQWSGTWRGHFRGVAGTGAVTVALGPALPVTEAVRPLRLQEHPRLGRRAGNGNWSPPRQWSPNVGADQAMEQVLQPQTPALMVEWARTVAAMAQGYDANYWQASPAMRRAGADAVLGVGRGLLFAPPAQSTPWHNWQGRWRAGAGVALLAALGDPCSYPLRPPAREDVIELAPPAGFVPPANVPANALNASHQQGGSQLGQHWYRTDEPPAPLPVKLLEVGDLDLAAVVGTNRHGVLPLAATLTNGFAQIVRVRLAPGTRLWIAERELREGDAVAVPVGLYPVKAAVNLAAVMGGNAVEWRVPRLIEITGPRAQWGQWRAGFAFWQFNGGASPDAERWLHLAEINCARYIRWAIGDGGFNAEKETYTTCTMDEMAPFLYALRACLGRNLVAGSHADWIPLRAKAGRFGDEGGAKFYEGGGLVGLMSQPLRQGLQARTPAEFPGHGIRDRQKTGYVFRNGWHGDAQDIFLTVEGKGQHLRSAHTAFDTGTFRLFGLGAAWAVYASYGRDAPREVHNVVHLPDDPINGLLPAREIHYDIRPDGSGSVSLDLDDVYLALNPAHTGAAVDYEGRVNPQAVRDLGIRAVRACGADFSGKSGAPGVVVIADRIRGGQRRVWAMHLPANTRAELHGHRFTLRSKKTDAFVAGTFLVPDDVQLRAQNGQLLAAGQSDFLVVMTLQRGPAPAVTRAGDLIRIGAQTARFDGTKVSFGEQAQ